MNTPRLLIILVVAAFVQSAPAQDNASVADKLPPDSIEIRAKDQPITDTPWQLPKPGDPLYDADQEALVKDSAHTHVARIYERGVFTGYKTVTGGPLPKKLAQEQHSHFAPNSKLPADAVELDPDEKPDPSEYFQKKPKKRPANVPANCIPVRVFLGKKLIGWTYMAKEAVAMLHQPNKT